MKTLNFSFVLFSLIFISCKSDYYSLQDFDKVEKIDAHYHIYSSENSSLEQAEIDNFGLIAINTYTGNCSRVSEVQLESEKLLLENPKHFSFTTTFCLDNWDDPQWVENTINWIDSCIDRGAIAVKVWKNIGMEFRDKDSNLVMIDDPKFDPVFAHLAEKGIPLVGHLGEPKNCWLPLHQMTTKNDSSYFARNPQYHMFLHPGFPSYKEQMAARDRMLEKNPRLIFIGCHLASLEWSVDTLAEFLNRFPYASVDMAARMGQLYFQTHENREKVREFFIRYQDRILYGTDIIDNGQEKNSFQKRMHDTWVNDWEFLVSDNKMTSNLIDGEFRGLKLPKKVIDKIYKNNALQWYKIEQ
jgi:predicted TIM-barrel fold metal-dependent hydrolase